MDKLNTTTFEIRRSRNIPKGEKGWINYNWIEESTKDGKKIFVVKTLDLPSCDPKYWVYKNDKVSEMTTAKKKIVDDAEIDFIKNNRSKQQILKDIKENFSSKDVGEDKTNLIFAIRLLNDYYTFTDAVDNRNFIEANLIIDMAIADGKCTTEQGQEIKGLLPKL